MHYKQLRIILPTLLNLAVYSHYLKKSIKKNTPLHISFPRIRKRVHHLCKVYGKVRYIIEGEENQSPDIQTLIITNHQSYMDPVVVMDVSKRPVGFVTKKENYDLPKLIGLGMDYVHNVPIDRDDIRSTIKAFQKIDKVLEENPDMDYCIFPEGTREWPPSFEMTPFHHGSFKIATRRNIPIQPIALYGEERILDSNMHMRRYPVQVRFLKPIEPEEYQDLSTEELADLVHQRIEEAVKELAARDYDLVKKYNRYSDKKMKKKYPYPEKVVKRY